jgi:GTPase
MAIDHVIINIQSGDGGAGAKSFRREKYIDKGGPDGGDGGRGGNIILQATSSLQSLIEYKTNKPYKARSGDYGRKKKMYGCDGSDLTLRVPIGTIVYDEHGEKIADLCEENSRYIAAKGGKGGRGNAKFASSINQAPTYAQPGLKGELKQIKLELRLLAEVGFVGLPNAGKSTLLKTLTSASPKVGAYPFTTLFPNLGTLKYYDKEIILADIPGLISGSADGQGLGHDFLRHIDRTRLLIHLVEATQSPEDAFEYYKTIVSELKSSEYDLTSKPMIVVLSKCDMVSEDALTTLKSYFKDNKIDMMEISSFSKQGIPSLIEAIYKLHAEHTKDL